MKKKRFSEEQIISILREKLAELSFEDLQSSTGAELHIEDDVADLTVPSP